MLLALDRPDIIAWLSLGALCVTAAGYTLIVPALGADGAAWVFCAGCVLLFAAYLFCIRISHSFADGAKKL